MGILSGNKLAFGLRNSRDLLEKLRSEIASWQTIEQFNVMGRAYLAFNCAVTAWHMTDWVWAELRPEDRVKIQTLAGTECRLLETEPKPLQEFARRQSPALMQCELIANGSKHSVLRKPDASVRTTITDGEGAEYGKLVVIVDGEEKPFDVVLWQSVIWWHQFLAKWHVAEEPPFVPHGDEGGPPPFTLKRVREAR